MAWKLPILEVLGLPCRGFMPRRETPEKQEEGLEDRGSQKHRNEGSSQRGGLQKSICLT